MTQWSAVAVSDVAEEFMAVRSTAREFVLILRLSYKKEELVS